MALEDQTVATEDPRLEADQAEPEAPEEPTVEETDQGTRVNLAPQRTRKERRAERDPIRTKNAEIDTLRQELAAQRQAMIEMQQGLLRQSSTRASEGQRDPFKDSLSSIRREQESISAALRGGNVSSEAEAERLKERFYELEDKKEELRFERLQERVGKSIPKAQDPNEAILRAEYPEVFNDTRALGVAHGMYTYLRQVEGKPESIATAREAMQRAAERSGLRMSAAPKPAPAQQARYGAISGQAGAKVSHEVVLNDQQRRLARAMYPSLDEDKAYVQWARTVGSKLNED
jgi:hypothetical protein